MDRESAQTFVTWFKENAPRLAQIRQQMAAQPTPTPARLEELFRSLESEISPLLQTIDPGLQFEVGPGTTHANAFILSAGGLSDLISTVQEIQALFGTVPEWEIVAFRPARALDSGVLHLNLPEQEPRTVDPRDILCALALEKNKIGVSLYFKGFTDEFYEAFGQLGFLCLDFALGEYRVMQSVGELGFHSLDEAPDAAFPVTQLVERFGDAEEQLRNSYARLQELPDNERIHSMLDNIAGDLADVDSVANDESAETELFLKVQFWSPRALSSETLRSAFPGFDTDASPKPSVLGQGYRTTLTGSKSAAGFHSRHFLEDALSKLPSEAIVLGFGEQEIPNPFLAQLIASQLIESEQIPRAIKMLRAVIAKHGSEDTGLCQAMLGLAYLKLGDGEHAAQAYEAALANASDESVRGEILNNRGSALQKMGRLKEALACFEQALELDPQSYGRQYNVGQAYAQLGQADEACKHLGLALSLNPDIRSHLENDKDLESIRDTAPYIRMMAALE